MSENTLWLLLARAWKAVAAVLALVCVSIWLIGRGVVAQGALPPSLIPQATVLVRVAGVCASAYGLWWLLALAETLLRRMRPAPLPTTPPQVLALRVPRPTGKSESLHAAQAAQQGVREAQAMVASLRQVFDLLETGQPERMSLEWWGGPTRRVTMAMTMPRAAQVLHLLRSLWAGAAPGSDVMPMADPAQDAAGVLAWVECRLAADATLPLRMVSEGEGDGLSAMVAALIPQADVRHVGIQVVLAPAPRRWTQRVAREQRWAAQRAQGAHDRRDTEAAQAMHTKAQDRGATACVRVLVRAATPAAALAQRHQVVALLSIWTAQRGATRQAWTVAAHGVTAADAPTPPALVQRWLVSPRRVIPPPWPAAQGAVICPEEVAMVWHWPSGRHRGQVTWRANTYVAPDHEVLGAPLPMEESPCSRHP